MLKDVCVTVFYTSPLTMHIVMHVHAVIFLVRNFEVILHVILPILQVTTEYHLDITGTLFATLAQTLNRKLIFRPKILYFIFDRGAKLIVINCFFTNTMRYDTIRYSLATMSYIVQAKTIQHHLYTYNNYHLALYGSVHLS